MSEPPNSNDCSEQTSEQESESKVSRLAQSIRRNPITRRLLRANVGAQGSDVCSYDCLAIADSMKSQFALKSNQTLEGTLEPHVPTLAQSKHRSKRRKIRLFAPSQKYLSGPREAPRPLWTHQGHFIKYSLKCASCRTRGTNRGGPVSPPGYTLEPSAPRPHSEKYMYTYMSTSVLDNVVKSRKTGWFCASRPDFHTPKL